MLWLLSRHCGWLRLKTSQWRVCVSWWVHPHIGNTCQNWLLFKSQTKVMWPKKTGHQKLVPNKNVSWPEQWCLHPQKTDRFVGENCQEVERKRFGRLYQAGRLLTVGESKVVNRWRNELINYLIYFQYVSVICHIWHSMTVSFLNHVISCYIVIFTSYVIRICTE